MFRHSRVTSINVTTCLKQTLVIQPLWSSLSTYKQADQLTEKSMKGLKESDMDCEV